MRSQLSLHTLPLLLSALLPPLIASTATSATTRRTVVGCHECGWSAEWNQDDGYQHYNFSLLSQINFHSAAKLESNGTLRQAGIGWRVPLPGARAQCDISGANGSSIFSKIREKCNANGVRLVLSIGQPATTAAEMDAFLDDGAAKVRKRPLGIWALDYEVMMVPSHVSTVVSPRCQVPAPTVRVPAGPGNQGAYPSRGRPQDRGALAGLGGQLRVQSDGHRQAGEVLYDAANVHEGGGPWLDAHL